MGQKPGATKSMIFSRLNNDKAEDSEKIIVKFFYTGG